MTALSRLIGLTAVRDGGIGQGMPGSRTLGKGSRRGQSACVIGRNALCARGKQSRGVEEERKTCLGRGRQACRLYRPFGLMHVFTLRHRSHCKAVNSRMESWFERISLVMVLGLTDEHGGQGWETKAQVRGGEQSRQDVQWLASRWWPQEGEPGSKWTLEVDSVGQWTGS